ncbi:MAG TPA: GDP-mannose 4,6-dehydratase [Acidobacteriaceae bacterium]|nr:GDP-mannose 4,6-dehydratase [Acidobacteriaceae bacterium]
MPRALITGITGFVGPWLAAYLRSQNIECVGIARAATDTKHPVSLAGFRIHDVDLRDRVGLGKVLAAEQPEMVFHLAAISHVPTSKANPELVFDVNATGTFNLLESLRQTGSQARVVLVSTGNLYGEIDSGDEGFSEGDRLQPMSPYATSKLIGEQIARSYFDDFGLAVVIARPFNHTGPGQPPSFACPEFARGIAAAVTAGQATIELKTGRLDPRRDITDVRDVVRAYALLASRGVPGEVYNVCSGSMVSMGRVVETLADLAHIGVTTQLDPLRVRDREIMRSGGNCSKIRRELGWSPEIRFEEMLQDLLDYWVDQSRRSGRTG